MKLIGIYTGNFQPPTRAHFQSYKRLRQIVGPDTFVTVTDRTPTPEAPLNVGDKEQVLVRHGIPASNIQRIQNWKQPDEIFHKFSSEHTGVIFALNQKEADEVAKRKSRSGQVKLGQNTKLRSGQVKLGQNTKLNELAITPAPEQDKEVWVEIDGTPSYFQPYKGNENFMKPFKEHGYVTIVDDTKIEGKPVSTTNIRQVLGSPLYTDDGKKKFFRFIFGWFDVGLYTLISTKFRQGYQVASNEKPQQEMPTPLGSRNQPTTVSEQKLSSMAFKENITKLVHEILREIMDEDYSSTTMGDSLDTSSDGSDTGMASSLDSQKSLTQQKTDAQKQRVDLIQNKKEKESEAKRNKQQRDQYSTFVKGYDAYQKKNDRDALSDINKQLSKPIQPTAPVA